MILDAESLRWPTRSRRCSRSTAADGEVKPELMESVLEIATDPHQTPREAGDQLRALRRQVAETAARRDLRDRLRRAPTRSRCGRTSASSPRPRYRDLIERAALRRAPGDHLRPARPRRARRPRQGDPRRQRDARARAAPARAVGANSPFWRADDTGLASTRTPIFRAFPRVGIPPLYDGLGGLRAPDRLHDRVGRDRGLHVPLVRRPPAPELRHGRDPRDGRPDARRAHAGARRAHPGDGQGARRALRGGQAARPLPVRDARREQVARRAPRAGRRARRPARATARAGEGARPAAARPPARARPGPRLGRELEGIDDLLERGNGAHRQRVVYEANHDLREVMGEIVAAPPRE